MIKVKIALGSRNKIAKESLTCKPMFTFARLLLMVIETA